MLCFIPLFQTLPFGQCMCNFWHAPNKRGKKIALSPDNIALASTVEWIVGKWTNSPLEATWEITINYYIRQTRIDTIMLKPTQNVLLQMINHIVSCIVWLTYHPTHRLKNWIALSLSLFVFIHVYTWTVYHEVIVCLDIVYIDTWKPNRCHKVWDGGYLSVMGH